MKSFLCKVHSIGAWTSKDYFLSSLFAAVLSEAGTAKSVCSMGTFTSIFSTVVVDCEGDYVHAGGIELERVESALAYELARHDDR